MTTRDRIIARETLKELPNMIEGGEYKFIPPSQDSHLQGFALVVYNVKTEDELQTLWSKLDKFETLQHDLESLDNGQWQVTVYAR